MDGSADDPAPTRNPRPVAAAALRLAVVAIAVAVGLAPLVARHFRGGGAPDPGFCPRGATPVPAVGAATQAPAAALRGPAGTACYVLPSGAVLRLPGGGGEWIAAIDRGEATGTFAGTVAVARPGVKRLLGPEVHPSKIVSAGDAVRLKTGDSVFDWAGAEGSLRNDGAGESVVFVVYFGGAVSPRADVDNPRRCITCSHSPAALWKTCPHRVGTTGGHSLRPGKRSGRVR